MTTSINRTVSANLASFLHHYYILLSLPRSTSKPPYPIAAQERPPALQTECVSKRFSNTVASRFYLSPCGGSPSPFVSKVVAVWWRGVLRGCERARARTLAIRLRMFAHLASGGGLDVYKHQRKTEAISVPLLFGSVGSSFLTPICPTCMSACKSVCGWPKGAVVVPHTR